MGDLRANGYLPDAATNYLLLLGWSHPQSKEIMPRDEMIKTFDIERIGKAAAVYDKKKLLWMNGQYIRKLDLDTLCTLVEPYMPECLRVHYSDAHAARDRGDSAGQHRHARRLPATRAHIFEPDRVTTTRRARSCRPNRHAAWLRGMTHRLKEHDGPITPEAFKEMILATGQETGLKGKDLYFPIRGAMTGSVHGPDLTRVAAVKGKDAVTTSVGRSDVDET